MEIWKNIAKLSSAKLTFNVNIEQFHFEINRQITINDISLENRSWLLIHTLLDLNEVLDPVLWGNIKKKKKKKKILMLYVDI